MEEYANTYRKDVPFNRTAYGIEMQLRPQHLPVLPVLLIAPLMELKLGIRDQRREKIVAFNRTAYGIEMKELLNFH